MSSALTFAGHLKAEIRLAQAVSEFEVDLSADQKAAFRSERTRAGNSTPTTQDVMSLTAEIDRKALKGSRCFGPRFTNVLHAVQKFASVGDIVVGGSQNLIACGVWAVVRMAVLAIPNSFSILDRLSNLFMDVGRSAPYHEKLALIYPQSTDLHNQLCEYYIVMVKLCHKLLDVSKKSTLEQIFLPLSETELIRTQNELKQWATSIAREIGRLTAQEVKQEAKANTKFRELVVSFSTRVARDHRLRMRARNLNACTTYNYEATWKQLRKLGKATVHHDSEVYCKWRDGSSDTTLIIDGKLGSGKSVLVANIVDDINLKLANTKFIVTYFFCQWDNQESLRARTVIGSLLRQILQAISKSSPIEQALTEALDVKEFALDTEELLGIFLRADLKGQIIYCLLDNVGDCHPIEAMAIQKALKRLINSHNIYLCLSKRTEAQALLFGEDALELDLSQMTNPDIEAFIDLELERCIENGRLNLGNAELVLEIHEALSKGAQGMFLWVALQIDSLCRGNTDAAIRDLLKNLPKTLAETFSRILNTSEISEHARYQRPMFNLILAAMRPLNLEELREALSVEVGSVRWDQTRLINNIHAVVISCGGLLIIDEENLTVRLVHPSVKQFLISPTEQRKEIFRLQKHMADIVVTYLRYSIFERRIVRSNVQLDVQAVPASITAASLSSKSSKSLALKLLNQKRSGNVDISRTVANINTTAPSLSHFLDYAKSNLRYHAWTYLLERDDDMIKFLLETEPDTILEELKDRIALEQGARRLYWDSDVGLRFMLYLKLKLSVFMKDEHIVDRSNETMWDWALRLGHVELLHLFFISVRHLHDCFKSGYYLLADEMLPKNTSRNLYLEESLDCVTLDNCISYAATILQLAVIPGIYPERVRVVEILLKYCPDIWQDSSQLPNPFFLALWLQEWKIAEMFLNAGAEIDHRGYLQHYTTLQKFISIWLTYVDEIANINKAIAWLVQHGADPWSTDSRGRNILERGSNRSQIPILMRALRSAGVAMDDNVIDRVWLAFENPVDRDWLPSTEMEPFRAAVQDDIGVVRWQDMDDFSTDTESSLSRIVYIKKHGYR